MAGFLYIRGMFDVYRGIKKKDLKRLLKKLIKPLIMANERIEAAIAKINAAADQQSTDLTAIADSQANIAADITRIKDSLPDDTDDALITLLEETANKVQANADAVRAAAASLKGLADENPEPSQEPPVEPA